MFSALRHTVLPLFIAFSLAPAGCGAVDTGDAGQADGGVNEAGDANATADGSACISAPIVGTSCTAGQIACPIQVDACCGGVVPVCQGSPATWMSFGLGCACPNTPCGDKSCNGGQVCKVQHSGVDGGSTGYRCEDMPTACAKEWTCACVKANIGGNCTASSCDDTGNHVKITCMGQ